MKKHLLLALLLFAFGARGFAQIPLTVADGTVTNRFVPVYGFYADSYLKCQVVYPAADLAGMTGGTITALTFYLSTTASDSWGSADFHVRLADQFAESTISAYSTATMTEVYSGSLDGTQPTMTVTFTTPFTYTGGNLLLEVTNETKGTYIDSYFYGITATGASVQGYSYTNLSSVTIAQRNFIPKTTFTYTPGGSGPMCFDPMGLTVSGETTDGATVSWTAPAAGDSPQGYEVCCQPADATFDAATANWTSVTGTTHTFTGLSAGTEYTVHVRSVCGTGLYSSGNALVNFTPGTCGYEFSLVDSYGDGWNGAALEVLVNGTTLTSLTVSGTSYTGTLMLPDGATLELVWTSGSYDSEASFTVTDPFGVEIYACSAGNTLSNGATFYTSTISCVPPTCPKPMNLTATNVTSDGATLTWTDNGTSASFEVKYVKKGHTDTTTVQVPALATTLQQTTTLTGLTLGAYTAYVRANCGSDGMSEWSAPVSFFPGSYNMGTISTLTTCSAVILDDGGIDGDYGANRNDILTIYPAVAGNQVQVSGTLVAENNYDYLKIYDGDQVDEDNLLLTSYGEETQDPPFHIPATISTTGALTITFHSDNSVFYAGFELNVECVVPPTCVPPTGLHASVTSDEATIGWTEVSGNHLGYQAEWDDSALPGLSGNPFSFTGLSPASSHTVRVRTVCASGDTSDWSAPLTFTTDCTPITAFPYIEDFENSTSIPACWRSIDGDGDGNNWFITQDSDGEVIEGGESTSGNHYITSLSYDYNTDDALTPNNWLLSPPFTLPSPCNLSLVWYAKSQDPSYLEPLDILMSTTGGDTAAFTTTVMSLNAVPGEYTQYVYSLANYAGQTVRFAFVHRNVTDQFRVNIDDVGILEIPQVVTNDATALATATATLNGSVTGQALTAIGFEWKASADSDYERDTVATGNHTGSISFNLANLDPVTSYTFRTFAAVEGIIFYGDEISFTTDQLPCPSPANLTVTDVNHESATVTWTSQLPTVGSYNVYLDNTLLNQTPVSVLTYPLTGLNPLTNYEVRVVTVCNGTEGLFDTETFTTPCGSVSVPYAENFDNYTQGISTGTTYPTGYPAVDMPSCWTFLNRSTTTNSYPLAFLTSSTDYAVSGKCLFFKSSSATPLYAVLPEVSEDLSNLQLTFTYRNEGVSAYNGTLYVGYMTDLADVSTFVEMYSCPKTTTKTEEVIYFNTVTVTPGTHYYIVFKYMGGSSNNYYLSIDNVSVDYIPSCPAPTTFTSSNVTIDAATLTWTAGGSESAWDLYLSSSSTDVPDATSTPMYSTSATSYTLTSLTDNTTYTAYVRANCGNGDVSEWVSKAFTTLCSTVSVPYAENFDSYTHEISTGTGNPSGYPAVDMPSCWTFLNRSTTIGSYPMAFLTSSTTYAVSGNCLFFKSSSTTPLYAVLPEMSEDLSNLQLTFTYRNEGVSTSNGTLHVGYMTDLADVNTYVEMYSCPQTTTKTEEVIYFNTVTVTPGTHYYIVFKYMGGSDAYYLGIDNVSVDYIPNCIAPTGLATSNVTTDGATLTWTAGGNETDWELYVADVTVNTTDEPGANSTPTATVQNNPTYTLTGLATAHTYKAYVRANCGSNDVSAWSTPVTFVPGSYTIDQQRNLTTCSATIYDDGGVDGNYGFNRNDTLTIYPTTQGNLVQVSGTLVAESASYDYLIIYDGENVDSQHQLLKTNQTSYTSTYQIPVITSTTGPLTLYFHSDNIYSYAGFELNVTCVPPCEAPATVQATAVSHGQSVLTFGYDQQAQNINLELQYKATNATSWSSSILVQDNTYTLAGLDNNTTYDVRVRSACGNADAQYYSEWVTGMIDIACPAPVIPDATYYVYDATTVMFYWDYSGMPTFNVMRVEGNNTTIIDMAYEDDPETYYANDLTPNTEYTFYVRSICNNGLDTSAWSNPITFTTPETCPTPAALTVSNETATGATLEWTANGTPNGFDVEYGPAGFVHGQGTSTTVPFTATTARQTTDLTGLSANTTYEVYVRAVCGNDHSDWSTVATFTTLCDAVTLPYIETFEDASNTRECWKLVASANIGGSNGMGFVTVDNRPTLRFSSFSSAPDYNQYGFSPLMNVSSNATNLKVKVTYATRVNDYLYFGYVTPTDTIWDPTAYNTNSTSSTYNWEIATFVIPANATQLAVHYYGDFEYYAWIDSVVITELTGDYCYAVTNLAADSVTARTARISWVGNANTYSIINMADGSVVTTQADTTYKLTNLTPETQYTFGVVANCTSSNSDAVYVTFTTPISCPAPTGLTAEIVETDEIMFSVNGGGNAEGYQVEYGATGFAHGQGTTIFEGAASTPPTIIVIDGLTASTTYDFYVRTICSEGDTSAWSPVTTENTLCDAVSSFPWSENFDAVSINTLPVCWTNTNDVGKTDWIVSSSLRGSISAHSASNVVQFYCQSSANRHDESSLQMPTFDLTALNNPMLGFWYTNKEWGGDQDEMTVYYRTSPTDTWTLLASYTDNVAAWTYDSLALPNPSATYQIKFVGITDYGYGINLDDIVIKEMPITVCSAPTDVTVSDITASTAEVNWTNNANLTYELQYRTAGTAPQTVDTNITAAAIANANGLNDGNNIGSGTIDANISYTGIQNSGSNAPKYYTTGENIRFYHGSNGNGNAMVLTPSNGAVITGLELTTVSNDFIPSVSYTVDGGNAVAASRNGLVYTIANVNASNSLKFQNTNTESMQLRITQMTVHYTLPGTENAWTTIVPATSPTVLSNLDPETGYEVQVRAICAVGDTSDWSSVVPFSTEEFICGAPVKLSVNDVTMNSAEVVWSDDGTYPTELQYMANGTPDQYVDNTFDFSQQGYTNAQSLDGVIVNLDNNITFVANKATGGTAPAYYTSGAALRIYGQNNFIVSAANGVVITGIEIDAVASYHPNINYVVDNGQSHSINGNMPYEIFNINAHTVTVTNPASTGNQLRMETLTVHYTIPGTAGTWTSMANVTSPVQLTGLMPNTNYSVRLRNICSASDTSVWTSTDFTTLSCPAITESITAEACESYTWDGTPYTTSGDYMKTYTLANGCDSVVTLHLTIHNPVHASVTEEACDSYTWNNTEYTQSGTYTYPHQDANNCTQVDTLHLTVFHPTHVAYTESACGTYTWNNTEYTQSGTYTYPHQDANGCTQVDTLHLTINNPTHMAYTESACGSYTWNNTEYTQSGTYTYSHQDANDCTQVDTLHLTIHPIPVVTVTGDAVIALYESATLTASGASTYVWNTGETAQTITVTPSSIGNHSYIVVGTSEFSCQSAPDTFVVEVGACRPGTSTETVTACDSFVWHGTTYTQSTGNAIYRIPGGSANGCDSVVTLHLTILNSVHNEITDANCVSYEWNGQTYTSSGDYTRTFQAANGCDSIVTLHLTIKQPVTKTVNIVDCDSYMWDNQTYTTSGDYTRTFTAANGCDSIVTLHLTIKNHVTHEITASNCGSYTWNNEVYETSGDYEQIFTAANGCDSVVTLHLTINPEYDLALEQSICKAALPYSWRDTLFDVGTETGTFVFHRQTAAGCDSIVTLHLVVNDAIATEVTETGCDSYTWNNQVYTTSGDYVQTLQTSAGCDSTVTMHLTIYSPVHEAITVVNCGPYQWNNAEYAQSGTYTYSHEDAHGCTQVDTLHLTVKPVPVVTITPASGMPIIAYGESETLTASGADSYVWNTQETTPSITVAPRITSTYSVVGTTDGCESESVSITVNVGNCTLITSEFTATGCGRYTWNGTVYEQSGDYQQLLVNDLGCDSLVTLHLTIYPNSGVAQTVNACGSYLWYHQNLTESGTYTFAYYDGNGCIQEDTLYLTIHHPVNESLNIVSCGPYMWNNTEYTQDGTYTYTHEDAHGCTQVDTLRLTIKPVPVVTVSSNNTQIVQHESTTLTASGATSYVWSNQATGATVTVTPMQTTTYSVVGTVDGCASEPATITVEVTPCTPAEGVFTVTACNRYVWYGTTYTESTNTATHAIQRPGMCDSIVTLHLTILHPVAEIINITACERYTWHNTTFTQSGRYTYSHQDANGCTQVDTLYLTILRPTHTAVTVSECNAFVWHNIEYTQSGTYTFAFADVNGCTQVDTLHLTIFHPAHTAYNVDACGSYVWNNTEYTQSGTYTYRHRDANGCQQIDTLHLTIHHPVAQSYEAVACESYTWNNTVYTQSGTYTYAHEDAHGCMQVDTLRLTIHNAVAESFEAEACGSYTWNNTEYTQSGIYTYAHADANGCTQVDTLHLTIYNAVAEVYEAEACESYTWNNTEYTQSGTYTYTHEDIHGCTQVDTLHLTIFQPATTEFSDNACGSYYWNNVYYNESGDYVQHFQTVDGCDSTVTLHLTIYPRAEVVSIVGDTLIHEYESATLTATALNGNPFWVGFGQTSSITVAPMTTTTYTVMAVSEHCASAPVRVTVTVLPCIPVQGVETITACESYEWHGVTYTESTNTPTFTIERQGVCDSVVTLHLTIFNPTHVAYTESACGSYVWNNTEYTQSGTYTYTHTDANGCTQVDTLHLTINNPVAATYEAEACGSYTWNNTEYTQSGTYTFAHLDANGCTQVDTLHLTIHNAVAEVFEAEACGSYTWNNTEYTQSGTYTFAHLDANGCTQVDTLHLIINNPTHTAVTESACGSYTWNNTEYTQSGTYTFAHTDAHGCTQVDTLHLTILNAVHEAFTVSECNAYTWHGTTYTQSGTYTFIHSDANGCTKVDTLHLTVFHPQPDVMTITSCGDFAWYGTVYTQSGVYTHPSVSPDGCDQVDTLYLTVNRPQNTSSTAEACGSYVWRGNTYTQSGVYLKAVQDNFGCMYLDTLYLTIHQPLMQIVEATACESYTWNNVTYTQSGHYVQHFQTTFGCDSTVTLNLTVNHPQHQSVTAGECGSYTWHGATYTASGVYTYVHSDANGCTQVDTLHLIIYQPIHQSLRITECESFTWGGTTYTQSGVYTYAHPDNHGCTQVDTLYLTINHPTGTSLTVSECGMYDWNGFIYTQSGTYTQSHLDANGCTQVDTLHLTIYHPVHQSVTVTECFEYTWHGTTYTQSGTYTYVHTDNHGCTQVDTLHLTIHHPQSSTITVDACGSYQWYGTNYTQSGVYTHNVTGTYGCQVKDTLILHIHQPVSTQFSARACSYYVWDGTVYTQSGDYVKHYYTQWGCDSTVTLHLDIHQPQSSEFTIVTENSCYTWNGVEYCQNGTYMQQFEDSYGCDSVVTLHLTLRVGVEDYDGYAVSLYPNPTTGVAYVEVSGDEMERVEVYDSYGKLLQTRNVSGNVAQIELSAYAKGVYHVRVTTTKGVVTKRVVKN